MLAFYSFIIDPYNIYYWLAPTFKLDIKLAENQRARRTQKQQLSKKQVDDIMNAQAAVKDMMKFALADRARLARGGPCDREAEGREGRRKTATAPAPGGTLRASPASPASPGAGVFFI